MTQDHPLINDAFYILQREIEDVDTSKLDDSDYHQLIYDVSRSEKNDFKFNRCKDMLYALAFIDDCREQRSLGEYSHEHEEERIKQEFVYWVGINFENELFNKH